MVDTLRELLAGVGWSHIGLLVLLLIIGRLIYEAGAARARTGFWQDYNRVNNVFGGNNLGDEYPAMVCCVHYCRRAAYVRQQHITVKEGL